MQYLRYLKQFFQIMFKIEPNQSVTSKKEENSDEETTSSIDEEKEIDDDEQLRTGSSKLLLTAVGIGYHNLTKTLV